MTPVNVLRQEVIAQIDRYISGTVSATALRTWALAHPTFANPKALDNSEDWAVNNALALMIAVAESGRERGTLEAELREAQQFLRGEKPFPEDTWPVGLRR